MSAASDTIPRSTMTTEQQRRIGALQVAKVVLSRGYNQPDRPIDEILAVARYVETGS
jgi:hypothetical protein